MLELQPLDIVGGYSAGVGQFGVLRNSSPAFQSCRETFQTQYFGNPVCTHMIYVRAVDKPTEEIYSFIKCFEDACEIKDGAKFGNVIKHERYIHIQPNWWQSQNLRFSLFTALLRAANNYPDLECAIQFEPYLKTTTAALSRFMEGQNFCYTTHQQWYATFNNVAANNVDSVMTIEVDKHYDAKTIKKAKEIDNIFKQNAQFENKRIAELCKMLTK